MTATHPKPFVVTEAWLDHNQVFVEGLDRNSSVPLPQPIALALIAAAKAGIESPAILSRYRYATDHCSASSWDFSSECRARFEWARSNDPEATLGDEDLNNVAAAFHGFARGPVETDAKDTREPVRASEDGGILDEAHLAINALGGAVQKGNVRDEVYNEAIGDALAEIEKLGGRDPVNLTVLRNALLDIVARGPGTEPENPRDEFGYFRGSGNEGDIADDVRAWERWEAAQIAGRALFNTRPDGAVDEDTKPPTPEPSDPSPDSVAGSVSRRADLNCEPSCNSPSNGLKPQPSPDLDMEGLEDRAYELIAHDADCSSHGRNDNCCNCGVVEFLNDLDTALKTLRGELEKPDTGKEFLSAANKYQSFLIERLEAERDSLKEHVERLLDLIKRVEQRWSYSPPVVEQELRKEMRTALKGGR